MKRWQEDLNHCKKQQKIWNKYTTFSRELGKFRKKHALDCGKVRCKVCHFYKYPDREFDEHEILSDIGYKEQLHEFFTEEYE